MVRRLRAGFAMLLMALLLPLQGYGAMSTCSEPAPAGVSAVAPVAQDHCTRAKTAAHQHNCSHGCCSAAMALTAARFIAPRSSGAEITCSTIAHAPEGVLERLDRPPRFALA
jgi:hypothetical protein